MSRRLAFKDSQNEILLSHVSRLLISSAESFGTMYPSRMVRPPQRIEASSNVSSKPTNSNTKKIGDTASVHLCSGNRRLLHPRALLSPPTSAKVLPLSHGAPTSKHFKPNYRCPRGPKSPCHQSIIYSRKSWSYAGSADLAAYLTISLRPRSHPLSELDDITHKSNLL